jgi:lipid-A-disaccharide synthase
LGRRVFITVADASADQHAAGLIRCLKSLNPSIEIDAIGGSKMKAAGANLLEDTVQRAAMGWRGALRALEARRWLKLVAARYRQAKPDLHICIDSSAINIPFATQAKGFGVPVLYYIAPQLWASREGRIKKMRKVVDHLACIFPFEQEYFRSRGVKATFVGHPLFDQLPAERDGTPDEGLTVAIIPGSRRSEVKANLPPLMEVMDALRARFSNLKFVMPTTSASDALVRELMHGRDAHATIAIDAFDDLVPRCHLVITKSGTSTIHVAAWNVPMIVVYRINPILWHLAGRWLIKTRKIAMVNILAGQIDLVPEFIPWYGPSKAVADCAIDLLKHPEKLADQKQKLAKVMRQLDRPGASRNAAEIAVRLMEGKES